MQGPRTCQSRAHGTPPFPRRVYRMPRPDSVYPARGHSQVEDVSPMVLRPVAAVKGAPGAVFKAGTGPDRGEAPVWEEGPRLLSGTQHADSDAPTLPFLSIHMAASNPLATVPPALKKITVFMRRAEELDRDTSHPVSPEEGGVGETSRGPCEES